MATPNYGYEKRQKELAKKRKKEDKLKEKAQRKQGGGSDYEQPSQAYVDPSPAPGDSGAGSSGAA
ncbi:MAG: hypothetical protein ABI434_20710 [Burkholderiaceae bacterium]